MVLNSANTCCAVEYARVATASDLLLASVLFPDWYEEKTLKQELLYHIWFKISNEQYDIVSFNNT